METHDLATLLLVAIYLAAALAVMALAARYSRRQDEPVVCEEAAEEPTVVVEPATSIEVRCAKLRVKSQTNFHRAITIGPDGNVYQVDPTQAAQQ